MLRFLRRGTHAIRGSVKLGKFDAAAPLFESIPTKTH
jgi:hypothetical protein